MNALLPLHPRFWLLLALCAAGFALLYIVVRNAGRGASRRALRQRIEALGLPAGKVGESAEPVEGGKGGETAVEALDEGMAQAQQALRRAPRPRAAVPVPWFLFFGDAAANLPGLLAAAQGERAPTAMPASGSAPSGATWWHWWLTGAAVAIEVHPDAVGDAAGTPPLRALWLRSLLALAQRRERLPLNGLVACVAATDLLLADAAELQPLAGRMRRVLDEASDTLRLQLPTYLIVTGLEQLPGYPTLRGALPPEVLAQVLGHRLTDPPPVIDAPAGERLDAVFDPIAQRLHGLRMALLREQAGPAGRLAIHEFVETVRALQPGLRVFAQVLFENHGKGPRAPRWRGLYFTAAASQAAGGAFVGDLFARFLPTDQPLVRPGRPSPSTSMGAL
jgi:type VI protein secretion system component VasK